MRTQIDGKDFDTARAQRLTEAWGHEFLGEGRYSGKTYWRTKRKDAPPIDIVGGLSRDIVRQSPRARAEAERVRQQSGVDVLNPEVCYDLEKRAGEAAAGGFSGWLGANSLFSLGIFFCYFAGMFLDTLPASIPLGFLGVTLFALGFRPARSAIRRKRNFKEYLPKIEAVRRVVLAAEEEWQAGWRPEGVPNP